MDRQEARIPGKIYTRHDFVFDKLRGYVRNGRVTLMLTWSECGFHGFWYIEGIGDSYKSAHAQLILNMMVIHSDRACSEYLQHAKLRGYME
jgi:hypothetical protein